MENKEKVLTRKEQDVIKRVAWVKAAQDAAQRAREAAERAMAVERAAAGRVIAMGQVADVVRIEEEAAYTVVRVKADEAQAAWDAATSWAMYAVVRNAEEGAWVVRADTRRAARRAQDVEVEAAWVARIEAEAAYVVVRAEAKVAWVKANRTWGVWEVVNRTRKEAEASWALYRAVVQDVKVDEMQ
jgi:hypothetical protein